MSETDKHSSVQATSWPSPPRHRLCVHVCYTPRMNEEANKSNDTLNDKLDHLESRVCELENKNLHLSRQLVHYETLMSSFNLETCSVVHQLYTSGVIKSQLVYQVMNSINASLFEDTSATDCYEDHAKLLTRVEPFVRYNSKILVLVNSFSGFYFVALALMAGRDFDERKHQQASSACVIGKVTRQDYKVIKSQYEHLLTTGRIKLNAFPDKSVANILAKGYPHAAPYDLIIVPEIGWANGLAGQVKPNGAIINPFSPDDTVLKDATGRLVSI